MSGKPASFLFTIALLALSGALSAQVQQPVYPFARDFVSGTIFMNDSSQKSGLIKYFPAQEEKLVFRENEKAPKQKFPPGDLAGFQADTFRFRSISEFEVYGNDFALLGKMSKINHIFGQLLDSGNVSCYLVYYSGYNALPVRTSHIQTSFLRKKRTADIHMQHSRLI